MTGCDEAPNVPEVMISISPDRTAKIPVKIPDLVPPNVAARVAVRHVVVRRVVLAGLIIALASYGWIRPVGEPATFDRYLRGLAQAQLVGGPHYAVIVGDSITANAPSLSVCGKPVVNAGFNGARVAELLDHVLPTLRANRPSALVLAAGVNDTWRHILTPKTQRLAEFRASYRALIDAAQALTPHVAIVLVPPVAQHGDLGAAFFDTVLIDDFNSIIAELAATAQVPTVSLAAMAGADGFARSGLTLDGVHPTAAGYNVWATIVQQAWTLIKPCR